jgi:hypothetical protein
VILKINTVLFKYKRSIRINLNEELRSGKTMEAAVFQCYPFHVFGVYV